MNQVHQFGFFLPNSFFVVAAAAGIKVSERNEILEMIHLDMQACD